MKKFGAPGAIRTHDLCLRRAALYPAELRVQNRDSHALTLTRTGEQRQAKKNTNAMESLRRSKIRPDGRLISQPKPAGAEIRLG